MAHPSYLYPGCETVKPAPLIFVSRLWGSIAGKPASLHLRTGQCRYRTSIPGHASIGSGRGPTLTKWGLRPHRREEAKAPAEETSPKNVLAPPAIIMDFVRGGPRRALVGKIKTQNFGT